VSRDAFRALLLDTATALARVGNLLARDDAAGVLLERLGWSVDALPDRLRRLGGDLAALGPIVAQVRADDVSPDAWAELADAVVRLCGAIRGLRDVSFGEDLDALQFGRELAEQLIHWAAIEQLSRDHPRFLAVLRAVGVVRVRSEPATPGRRRYRRERLALPDLGEVLTSPGALFRAAWAWADPAFDGTGLLGELAALFRTFGVPAGFVVVPPSTRELEHVEPGAMRWHLVATLLGGAVDEMAYEAGLRLVPTRVGTDPAIAILPYVTADLGDGVEIGDGIQISIAGAADPAAGRALVVSPSGIAVVDDFFEGETRSSVGEVSATLRRPLDRDGFAIGAGELTGTGWAIRAAARAGPEASGELLVEAVVSDARVGVPIGGSGLLASLLRTDRATIPVPILLGVSTRRGVYLGPGGRAHDVELAIRLGPVEVRRASLAVDAIERGIRATIRTSLATAIGPVRFVLDGVGLAIDLAFPRAGGNLGLLDLRTEALRPTGIGIAIDTALVKGTGVVARHAPGDYRGGLRLDIAGVSVTAMGLFDDRTEAGRSFAALAGARFPRVQIGWGFTLDGIGGIIAIHRRFDLDRVRADLARGNASLLLDTRPADAELLARIDALAALFPVARGRHVVGPTASVGWGTPQILQADLALLVDLPAPIRIVLLGALQLGLPTLAKRVVDLRLDLLGVLDFERKSLALDASLHDSKLAGYPLTGDMALRMGWGDPPHFLLAIGGFHPRFAPPPAFPALRRLAVTAGDNPQLRLEAYLALTSNTAQVGAHVDLTYSGRGFHIAGHLGFDALFEFVPFHFEVDIAASASISYRGYNVSSVELAFLLTGPRPWRAKGNATFSIYRWDVSVEFDATWGNATPASLPPPPDVAARLREALLSPEAWVAALSDGELPWVGFEAPAASYDSVRVHPFSVLTVRQRAMPLDYDITQFGNIPLEGPRRFSIDEVRVGNELVTAEPVDDRFARGQFTRLSSEQRLSAPSFERFAAGVRIGAGEVRLGPSARAAMETDTILDDPLAPPTPPPRVKLSGPFALAAEAVRPTRPAGPPQRAGPRVKDLEFALASTEDLSITELGATIGRGATNYGALREALDRYIAETGRRPPLQVVPRVEVRDD
jgi:hypothetical protein